jgi:histone H3/H4
MGMELKIKTMKKLCKKALGQNQRVSKEAAKTLAKALEEIGVKIAREALDYMWHDRRVTLKAEDIEIAAKKIRGE